MMVKYILEDGKSIRIHKEKNLEKGFNLHQINIFIVDNLILVKEMVKES